MLGIKRSSQLTLFILCLRNTLYWYIVSIVRFVWYFNWQVWNITSQCRKVFIGSMCISIKGIFLLNSLYLLTLLKRPSQWRAKPQLKYTSYKNVSCIQIKKRKIHPQKRPSVIEKKNKTNTSLKSLFMRSNDQLITCSFLLQRSTPDLGAKWWISLMVRA